MDWSDERVGKLKQLWKNGLSANDIANELGRGVSANAVRGKVHRLGLNFTRPSEPATCETVTTKRRKAPRTAQIRAPVIAVKPVSKPFFPQLPVLVPETELLSPTATIFTLGEHMCKWPIGDPGDKNFGFCGRSRTSHKIYCDTHAEIGRGSSRSPRRTSEPRRRSWSRLVEQYV